MAKILQGLTENRKRNIRVVLAKKDEEIAALKDKLNELYAENYKLRRENRKLSIRNGEVTAAYNSLKEILRNRGVETP